MFLQKHQTWWTHMNTVLSFLPMTNCLALISPLKAVKSKCLGRHTPATYHWSYRKVFPRSLTTMCASTAIFTSTWWLVTNQTSLLHISLGVNWKHGDFQMQQCSKALLWPQYAMVRLVTTSNSRTTQKAKERPRKRAYWDASILSSKAQRAASVPTGCVISSQRTTPPPFSCQKCRLGGRMGKRKLG